MAHSYYRKKPRGATVGQKGKAGAVTHFIKSEKEW